MYLHFTKENKHEFLDDIKILKKYMTQVDFDVFLSEIEKKNRDDNYLKITNPKVKRTIEQNAYYWGAVIPFIHKLKLFPKLAQYQLSDNLEVKNGLVSSCRDLYHGTLSNHFLGYQVGTKKEIMNGTISSSSLSISGFEIYLKLVDEWFLEQTGLYLPSSDEFKSWDIKQINKTQDDFFNSYIKANS